MKVKHTDRSPLRLLFRSRLWLGIRLLSSLLLLGSCGFYVLGRLYANGTLSPQIETHWSLLDCVYMTVITVSTIGYGEVLPLPDGVAYQDLTAVRTYIIVLIMFAMILVAYSVSSATAFFVDGDLRRLLRVRSAMKRIAKLDNHFVICGCGVTGRVIADELLATNHQVVLIDDDAKNFDRYVDMKEAVVIEGDAMDDEILEHAGIGRAKGLAAALPDDKDNLFLIISARQLNPTLRIVSGATTKAVARKLRRAGADGVVSQATIGGLRIASELMRPAVVSFLDHMLRGRESPVRFAQVEVGKTFAGRTLAAVDILGRTGLPVLAVRDPSQADFAFNPGRDHVLREDSTIVTMGETARVEELVRLIGDRDGAEWIVDETEQGEEEQEAGTPEGDGQEPAAPAE